MMALARTATAPFFFLLFALFSSTQVQAQVQVSLPTLDTLVGDDVTIPLTVSDLTGQQVVSYSFTVTYDPTVLTITDADVSGTLSEGALVVPNTTVSGEFTVAVASSQAFAGEGTLINMIASVIGEGTTSLSFTNFTFNEGSPTAETTDGSVTASEPVGNQAPAADEISVATEENTPVTITLSGTDPEGTALTFAIESNPNNGALGGIVQVDDQSATVEYTPNDGYSGVDTFSYSVSDGEDSDVAFVTITVGDPPEQVIVTLPDLAVKTTDSPLRIPINVSDLTNMGVNGYQFTLLYDPTIINITDTDDDDTLTDGAFIAENFLEGEVRVAVAGGSSMEGSGVLLYLVADLLAEGTTDLTFSEFKFNSGEPEAITNVGSVGVFSNLPPTSDPVNVSTPEDTLLDITLTGEDEEGAELLFRVVSGPQNGRVGPLTPQAGSTATIAYTPDDDFFGIDSFVYSIDDGEHETEVVVTVDVMSVNDAPDAQPDSYDVEKGGMLDVDATTGVLANDTDVEGDAVTAAVVQAPSQGTLTLNADGSFSYTPDASFEGVDTFTYAATDGMDEMEATVEITVFSQSPTASMITSPSDGSTLVVGGDSGQDPQNGGDPFVEVTWEASTDPDGDAVTYRYELAGDAAFTRVYLDEEGMAISRTLTVEEAASFFDQEEAVSPDGEDVTFYHRITVSDGFNPVGSDELSMVWVRGTVTAIGDSPDVPAAFLLKGNYPNPFNPSTTIRFDLPATASVRVSVLDMLGREVLSVPERSLAAGANHQVQIDASRLSSGIYLYRVEITTAAERQAKTGLMTLLK